MNRRDALFAWFGSFFGFLTCGPAYAATPTSKKEKGVLCFYINVGMLPPYKAEAFVERCKDKILDKEIKERFITFWFPIRTGSTRVELLCGDVNEAQILADKLEPPDSKKASLFTFPDKSQVRDYILLMLGAPITKIELDENQIDMCYDMAVNTFNNAEFNSLADGLITERFRQLVLARATIVLGMVRSKWVHIPGPGKELTLNGPQLVEQGKQDLDNILQWIEDHKVV